MVCAEKLSPDLGINSISQKHSKALYGYSGIWTVGAVVVKDGVSSQGGSLDARKRLLDTEGVQRSFLRSVSELPPLAVEKAYIRIDYDLVSRAARGSFLARLQLIGAASCAAQMFPLTTEPPCGADILDVIGHLDFGPPLRLLLQQFLDIGEVERAACERR